MWWRILAGFLIVALVWVLLAWLFLSTYEDE